MDFTHLHVHTEYSLLDGVNKIENLFKKAAENKMGSMAITDHGVLYGAAEFWKMSHDFHIKPIIGCEIYLAPAAHDLKEPVDGIRYYHLLLLAKNLQGYKNLVKLVTIGQLEGMYYRPRVDRETLKKYSSDLICTSACLAGPISRHIVRDEYAKAEEWLEFLKSTFADNFYLELQRNGFSGSDNFDDNTQLVKAYDQETLETIKQQMKVNQQLRVYADKYKLPLVATTDAHYLNNEDRDVQTILFCIKDGTRLDEPNIRTGYVGTYIKSAPEMQEHFADDLTPVENTLKIAEQIEDFSFKFDRVQPRYLDLPKKSNIKDEMRKQTYEGAKAKYHEITPELEKRIDYELMVIDKKGYNDYFLIVSDFMKYARKQGIVIGVRGSAAGSVVAYCLDITNIEPIKWELYFERFLNLERPSPPDIDMDLQDNRRDEVIEYAKQKYGEMNVAAICAMGSMQTKAAIRDVSRTMGIDLKIADQLSKKVQVVFGKVFPIDKMMEVDPEFAAIINSDPKLQEMAGYVRKIEGLSRHISTHAAGYLITPNPIDEYMPLQRDSKDPHKLITQLDGNWIDKLDFMKFDFLGLRTLTIIKNTLELVKKKHKKEIRLRQLPEDDPETFALFSRGETVGVFQFESPPMQQYLRDLKPETLEDICFLAAAYRPGPMEYIPRYIECKHGTREPEYLIPELEPILAKTYGFPIYQEQLFRICVDLGGFTMAEGDVIRNALKKKQLDILESKAPDFKKYFCEKYKYSEEMADKVWDQLRPFADYGFNKAHSASYAVVAYWCAYLKAHYPLEFISALMHSDLENTDRIIVDIRDAKRMGFNILPPDINKSHVDFVPENKDAIRFGLGAIKGVGVKLCENMVQEREKNGVYRNLDDLVIRNDAAKLNRKALENLIRVGALDTFGERNALLTIMPVVLTKVAKKIRAEKIGQNSLFNFESEDGQISQTIETPLPQVAALSNQEKLDNEKELLGLYISHHPLEELQTVIFNKSFATLSQLETLKEGDKFKSLAMLSKFKVTFTKKDNKPMGLVVLEDLDRRIEGVIFPKTYDKVREILTENKPLLFSGLINLRNDSLNLIIDDVQLLSSEERQLDGITIDICDEHNKERLLVLKTTISQNPGTHKLRIHYGDRLEGKTIIREINLTDEVAKVLAPYRIKNGQDSK